MVHHVDLPIVEALDRPLQVRRRLRAAGGEGQAPGILLHLRSTRPPLCAVAARPILPRADPARKSARRRLNVNGT